MNFSAIFIKRPIMTTIVMVAILLVGIYSYFNLPVSAMPDVAFPYINVTVEYPGASPETMANNFATPLEREFLTISGLQLATSNNTLGSTNISLQFDLSKNIDSAALDVQAAITRALPNLPPNLPSAPSFEKVNPSQVPVIYYCLTSESMSYGEMYDYAKTSIAQRLALINGVAKIIIYGSPSAVRVQVDPGKMASMGIALDDVSNAITQANPYLPVGGFDGPDDSSTIITEGQLKKAIYYEPLIVKYQDQAPVRIKDIGQAIDSQKDYKTIQTFYRKGQESPSVIVALNPQPGANIVHIANEANKALPTILKELPPSLKLENLYDESQLIRDSAWDVQLTLIIAFILVVFIIFLYLGQLTETIIPIIVLPLSIVGTFAIMHAFNFNLDILSLMALILAIGFIIDDAIVVMENIVRHVEIGESPWEAALEGSKRIGFTILSMTLSLIAVFIPLLFMQGLLGKVLAEFAVTLTAITLLSGFISLTVTPMLCSIFIYPRKEKEIIHIGHRVNNAMLEWYKPALQWVLDRRWIALVVFIVCTFFSLYFLIVLPKDFIPNEDINVIELYTQAAQGTSSDRMKEYQRAVFDILKKDPNIESFISVVPLNGYRNGFLAAALKPRNMRDSTTKVVRNLYQQTSQIIGVNTFYRIIPMIDLAAGFQVKGAISISSKAYTPSVCTLQPKNLKAAWPPFPGSKE